MATTPGDTPTTNAPAGGVRRAVRHSFIYGLGMLLRRVASFLMLPVYTRWLDTAEYGTLELLNVTLDMVALVLGMGLTYAIFRFYARAESPARARRVMSTVMLLLTALYAVGSLAGVAGAEPIARLTLGDAALTHHVRVVFLSLLFMGLTDCGMASLQARQESVRYVTISTVQLAIQLSLIVYLLVFRDLGVLAVLYGNLATFILVGVFMLVSTWRAFGLQFDWALGRDVLRYSVPLLGESLCAFVLTFGDRFFLNHLRSVEEVGVYALGYKLGLIMLIANRPFWTYWEAERFRIANRTDAADTFRRYFTYFLFMLLIFAVGVSTLSRDVLRIMSADQFHEAYRVVWIIAGAYVVHLAASYCMVGILVAGRTEFVTVAAFVSAALCLAMNAALVPRWGMYGAAVATLVPFTLRWLLVLRFSNRFLPVRYAWTVALRLTALAAASVAVSLFVEIPGIVASLAFNLLLCALFSVAAGFVAFTASERRALSRVLLRPRTGLRALFQSP